MHIKTVIITLALIVSFTSAKLFAATTAKENSNTQPTYYNSLLSEKNIRQITDDEFNGTAPIQLGLNEELLIPMNLTLASNQFGLSNSDYIHVTSQDEKIIETTITPPAINLNTVTTIAFNILCNPVVSGSTTVSIDCLINNATYKKDLTINVVDNSN